MAEILDFYKKNKSIPTEILKAEEYLLKDTLSKNLTRDKKIKELDGVVGIVGVKPFCIKEDKFNNLLKIVIRLLNSLYIRASSCSKNIFNAKKFL